MNYKLKSSKKFCGHKPIAMTNELARSVVKIYALCQRTAEGLLFIQQILPNKYNFAPSTAECYEPLIHSMVAVGKDISAAEDILMKLINAKLTPTTTIVNSFVEGYIRRKEPIEALDFVIDVYTQHQVRPAVQTIMALIQYNLLCKDVYEANRVATTVRTMFTDAERREAVYVPRLTYKIGPSEIGNGNSSNNDDGMSDNNNSNNRNNNNSAMSNSFSTFFNPSTSPSQKTNNTNTTTTNATMMTDARKSRWDLCLSHQVLGVSSSSPILQHLVQTGRLKHIISSNSPTITTSAATNNKNTANTVSNNDSNKNKSAPAIVKSALSDEYLSRLFATYDLHLNPSTGTSTPTSSSTVNKRI